MFKSGNPGRGGVSRGRGDAQLSYGEESPHASDAFEARRLDPASALDMEQMQLLGVGSATPEATNTGEASGLQRLGPDAGNAAWQRRLAPRHRRAVGAFFGGSEPPR